MDIRGSVVIIASAVRHWALTAVLATLVVTASAILAGVAVAWFQSYLLGGAIWKGPVALIVGAVAASGLVLVWWALTKWPWSEVRDAARHNSENAGPSILIALIASGWIDGIAGMFGIGPLRPGVMTITGTVALILVTFIVVIRSRRSIRGQAGGAAALEPR